MSLTPNQFNTLKAAILADPVAGPIRAAGDTVALLAWCNTPLAGNPAWRTNVPAQESDEATPWVSFDGLVSGKRESWVHAFMRYSRDYSRNAVRKWVTDTWGNATAGSNAETILLAAGTEVATQAQVIIGGATPSTGTVTALKRNFDGLVSQDEVNKLVN